MSQYNAVSIYILKKFSLILKLEQMMAEIFPFTSTLDALK